MSKLFLLLLSLSTLVLICRGESDRPRHLPKYTFGRPFGGFTKRVSDYASPSCAPGSYQEGYLKQPLDHFGSGNQYFQEHYQYNLKYYDAASSNVVFFMLGEETPIRANKVCNETFPFMMWAKKHKAAVFQAEHRFFGKTRPFQTQTVEALQWFVPEQILADYDYFIAQMNQLYFGGKSMKWVLFGGSYAGTLTAWMRVAYPNASIAGISSSSAVDLDVDYYGYATNMQKNYNGFDASCGANLQKAFKKIQSMSFSEAGRQQLTSMFNLCDPFPAADVIGPKDLQFFWSNVFGEFQGINQYSGDNGNVYTADRNLGIPGACAIMTNLTDADVVQRVANVINWVNDITGEAGICMPNKYADYISTYASPYYDTSGSIAGGRSWMWQCCSYMGYFQTTDGGHDSGMWGSLLPLDFFVDQCIDLFNATYNADFTFKQVQKYRQMFGGSKHYPGTKVVFPNGSLDPWLSLGLLEGDNNIGNEVFATTVQNQAHCSDMYPPRPEDSASLTATRQLIDAKLDSFIQFS